MCYYWISIDILNNILKWKWENNKFITNHALKYIIEVGGSTLSAFPPTKNEIFSISVGFLDPPTGDPPGFPPKNHPCSPESYILVYLVLVVMFSKPIKI